jgi:hypothetical protein
MIYSKMNPDICALMNEDLLPNEDTLFVAQTCGLETAISLINELPGMIISIPTRPYKRLIEKYILETYDGTRKSIQKIQHSCNVSERYVRDVLKRNGK